ncbi:MAG: GDP-fucose synthetase [Piscirickettsiaceae bacterium]|nr:MAG: GDP-fucose synthetase [Piscirickettsiaceae bacterium]
MVLAAAKVGGIFANNEYPAEFIYENLMVQTNVIHQAYQTGVKQLLFLGSSCIYPKLATQPIIEEALLTGVLEPTNEPYAIAKIAGIKLCESYNRQYGTDFRSLMPTNLYGLNDSFDIQNGHVIPSLIRKIHEATVNNSSSVEIWGTGTVRREFLYVDDLADACVSVLGMKKNVFQMVTGPSCNHLNVGTGKDVSIHELVSMLVDVIGFKEKVVWNTCMPDGTPRKLLDVSKLSGYGWTPKVSLEAGLKTTYDAFLATK